MRTLENEMEYLTEIFLTYALNAL